MEPAVAQRAAPSPQRRSRRPLPAAVARTPPPSSSSASSKSAASLACLSRVALVRLACAASLARAASRFSKVGTPPPEPASPLRRRCHPRRPPRQGRPPRNGPPVGPAGLSVAVAAKDRARLRQLVRKRPRAQCGVRPLRPRRPWRGDAPREDSRCRVGCRHVAAAAARAATSWTLPPMLEWPDGLPPFPFPPFPFPPFFPPFPPPARPCARASLGTRLVMRSVSASGRDAGCSHAHLGRSAAQRSDEPVSLP